MNKRINQKKQRREEFRDRLKKAFAIFLCIVFLVAFINITDMSTRRMIMCNDDKYAMAVSLKEDNLLRLDIAGEKLIINIETVIKVSDYVVSSSKRYYDSLMKIIRDKL